MVPTLDHYRSYASKAQQQLVNQFLSSRFSGRSWDRIWFDDEDETSVKSHVSPLGCSVFSPAAPSSGVFEASVSLQKACPPHSVISSASTSLRIAWVYSGRQ
jgi:hypothetical protein